VHHLEDDARFPAPVIYRNTSNALGALGNYTHDVVLFFGIVDLATDGIRRLGNQQSSNGQVDQPTATHLADTLLGACQAAVAVLPAFKGTPKSEYDAEFASAVSAAQTNWEPMKMRFSGPVPFESHPFGKSQTD